MKLSIFVFGVIVGLLALTYNVQAQSCDTYADPELARMYCVYYCQYAENCDGGDCIDVGPVELGQKACLCIGCNDATLD